ncbi:MAG: alpha/beta hydrolase [Gemmatimonadota bacterium]|nr:alpha/beta hydrolase [Gemmatimonadota bacterium]
MQHLSALAPSSRATGEARRRLILAIALTLAAGACSSSTAGVKSGPESIAILSDCAIPAATDASAVNFALEVEYSRPGGQPQQLDVAWPRDGRAHPLVLFVHGGGWQEGDKLSERQYLLYLAGLGYSVATINYRLASAPSNLFPAAIQDVRCALRWLRQNASRYGIDPARVVAAGESAGGHLVSLLGTTPELTTLDGPSCPVTGQSLVLSGVLSLYAPEDIRRGSDYNAFIEPTISNFLGAEPEATPQLASLASPVAHVKPGAPPFLLVHGALDALVPLEQSSRMRDTLQRAGVPATLVVVPGAAHGFPYLSTERIFRSSTCTILAFLDKALRP